jgi:hypothetical protein
MVNYAERALFAERLSQLSKSEYEEVFRILKRANEQWSENSNGIFFDINAVSTATFEKLQFFMNFCMKIRSDQDERMKAIEALKAAADAEEAAAAMA